MQKRIARGTSVPAGPGEGSPVLIRPYREQDGPDVRSLFISVNRQLAPPHMKAEFEIYISRSLEEEVDRIPDYYAERAGSFWVAERDGAIAGMYGVEGAGPGVAELRRMYVAPRLRRQGIASALLRHAEQWCCANGYGKLVLSTSELQAAALALYRRSGYRLLREETATGMTNKTIGGGIRRVQMEKSLGPPAASCGGHRS